MKGQGRGNHGANMPVQKCSVVSAGVLYHGQVIHAELLVFLCAGTSSRCQFSYIAHELIPDSRRLQEDGEETKCCHQPKRLRQGPVTDIMLWVECYATLVAVLVERYPEKAAGLWLFVGRQPTGGLSIGGDGFYSL